MALTFFQREICRLLAQHRFHDSEVALEKTWATDRALLESRSYAVQVLRDRPGIVEAEVSRGPETIVLQWTRDSAFRFFPLVEHHDFGLTLHPFDLATNKVLALVGRLEVRDWVDVIHCHDRVQPLGYLAWAACGKDPGFGPLAILEHAARSSRYSADEVSQLVFEGKPPDAKVLGGQWHAALSQARILCAALPAAEVGRCVLGPEGRLYTADAAGLAADLKRGNVRFHAGRIKGAVPVVTGPTARDA